MKRICGKCWTLICKQLDGAQELLSPIAGFAPYATCQHHRSTGELRARLVLPDGAVFTIPRLADFRIARRAPLGNCHLEECDLDFETQPQTAWVSFGKQRWLASRKRRRVTIKERYKFSVFGEFFNAFNIANLTSYGFSLSSVNPNPAKQAFSFGQPTQRFGQVFGSGGPRAIQVGGRFTF